MLKDKQLDKISNILGLELINEINALDSDSLKNQIVQAETAMKDAKQELEANPKYEEIKEQLKAITAGLKEVRKFQNAKIAYALDLLESKGQ
jgi:hypothetical protein